MIAGMRLTACVRATLAYGGKRLELPPGEYLVGRSPDCAIRIDDPHVSRVHLRLRVSAEGVVVEDMGGKNVAQINGRRMARSVSLADGDELRLGAESFRVELQPDAACYDDEEDTITMEEKVGPSVAAIPGCPRCDAVVDGEVAECPHCGHRLQRHRAQELPLLDDDNSR
jgi:predicted component of type VI protein secretion system